MITERHREFARTLASLAREHGVNHIEMTFDLATSNFKFRDGRSYNKIRMTWQEGRHGAVERITLTGEQKVEFKEVVDE